MEGQRFFVQIVRDKMIFFLIFKFYLLIFSSVIAEDFVYGLDGIPVFKNMEYVEDSNVLFDKIDGRFVSSEMVGNYNVNDIKEFYISVLPNLGWEKIDENFQ